MDKVTLKKNLQEKMDKALKVLDHELKGLRTGRASVNLLDSVTVEAYGDRMPLSQVASLTTPDARTINVQVWDKSIVSSVEKAITVANLGLTLSSDGQLIRLPIPALTEERRKELAKLAHKYGEDTKISLRNIRRDGNEELKKMEKDNIIAKDEHHSLAEQVQKLTDEYSSKVDSAIKQKEQEIMTV
ncbi:ribosome recycling factor [Rickettsia endosymbiont of Seladonia tumulorum]|uniref:ribosome recycling factor n=1 Tax=Rickettsia endosymbiont of Seladonia tumulorum TaxID=3066270 RepID=UPI00313E46FA